MISNWTERVFSNKQSFVYQNAKVLIYGRIVNIPGFPDRTPKPAMYEVKKVFQPAGITVKDIGSLTFDTLNREKFTNLDKYRIVWELTENGKIFIEGKLEVPPVLPGESFSFTIPIQK